jgi:hypothetical protein
VQHIDPVGLAVTLVFDDLSGVELRRRLTQRGLPDDHVEMLIDHRDNCETCRGYIAFYLKEYDEA